MGTRAVIVKTMNTVRDPVTTFRFFTNLKNWETGGALKDIHEDPSGWWLAKSPAGDVKIRVRSDQRLGVIDHDFMGESEWSVFCRVIPNEAGSTVSWTFLQPPGMTYGDFEEQLNAFDKEIQGWKGALEAD